MDLLDGTVLIAARLVKGAFGALMLPKHAPIEDEVLRAQIADDPVAARSLAA